MDLGQEKDLIARARIDPHVFGGIYEEYYPKMFRYALRRVGAVGIAEDITSETFFKALKSLWQFKWRNISFSAWLYKIATNEINYYFRCGGYRAVSLELLSEKGFDPLARDDVQAELDEAETQLHRHQDFLIVREEIGKLPEKYQEVIALRFFENKKICEVAEILGKKEGTIKSLLSRGLDMLRDNLNEGSHDLAMQPFSEMSIIKSGRRSFQIEK
jgi:RNA polymerase sigma-70 factor, ECF subfamily